jgi:tetratricopeptide (TPR) repeat protein
MSRRRIFVSATTRDLGSYRRLASESLRKRGYDVDDQAIFNLTYLEVGEKLKRRIEDCDAVVCLIGHIYGGEPSGHPPDQPPRSFTQWEFYFARELGKPVYLLLADERTPFDPHEPESQTNQELQRTYRDEVTRDRDWRSFNSVDQLRAELAELRFPWEGPPPDRKPSNLPLPSIGTLFKGRDAFLDELRRRLGVPDAGSRPTAIVNCLAVHGLGGVGKTRAALEYAWRHADDYTALLFVSAPSPDELRANLAGLASVLGTTAETAAVEEQLAAVLDWLDAHPGWLLIVDNVDTEEAADEVQRLLARLRAGHVLITSRIGNWGTGVEPLDLGLLAPEDAVAFLLERTPHRRRADDDAGRAAAIAGQLDGLALALEQAGAYIDRLRLTLAEYLGRWESKRPEVLRWHDPRLMQYPASVAVTWETTFAQLGEAERRLLDVLSWLAPEPIPLLLFDAAPLVEAVPDPREALADLAGYSLVRFDAAGEAVLVHRLVQEITRGRVPAAARPEVLQLALDAVNAVAPVEAQDVRTWGVWTPLAAHAEAVSGHGDADGLAEPTGRLMNQLGLYWQARGQFAVAEPLYRRGLAILERSLGPDHPDVARVLGNLAVLLLATNRLVEAEPLLRRALAILERSLGPDHPDVATTLGNLAGVLQATNRLVEAEPLYRRALAILERSLGPDHPDVATVLNNLAEVLRAINRPVEAEPLNRRALAIRERSLGPDHPDVATTLNNLAGLLYATNRPVEAEPLFRRALAIGERSLGPDHPDVAAALNNLAELLRATNRPVEAEPLYRRALAIRERSLGPDHPDVATTLNNLALLLETFGRPVEAEPLLRRHLEIFLKFTIVTGHEHPHLRQGVINYSLLLEAMGSDPEQIRTRLDEIMKPFGFSVDDFRQGN